MAPAQKVKDPSYENPYIDPMSGQDKSLPGQLKSTFAPTVDLDKLKANIAKSPDTGQTNEHHFFKRLPHKSPKGQ